MWMRSYRSDYDDWGDNLARISFETVFVGPLAGCRMLRAIDRWVLTLVHRWTYIARLSLLARRPGVARVPKVAARVPKVAASLSRPKWRHKAAATSRQIANHPITQSAIFDLLGSWSNAAIAPIPAIRVDSCL